MFFFVLFSGFTTRAARVIDVAVFFSSCLQSLSSVFFFFFFCVPQLYLFGSPFWVRFMCM